MLYGFVILVNLLVWMIAWVAYHRFPISLSLCFLAYGFGLKHGLDADHITAIDNVTRKLVQKHYQPTTIGFYFSLGHSTVVLLLTLTIVLTAHSFHHSFATLSRFGNLFGSLFSGLFLLVFALINGIAFFEVIRNMRRDAMNRVSTEFSRHPQESGDPVVKYILDSRFRGNDVGLDSWNDDTVATNPSRGFLSRLFSPLFKVVNKSWHMLPIGFLFGLGFDTATEVALLGISAYQATHALSLWVILVFPMLFTAGMCLIDTTGGLCMLGACQWACVNPFRKTLYNLVITGISFTTALFIGGYELLALLAQDKHWHFNTYLNSIDHHFTNIGLIIVFAMSITWLLSRYFAKQRAS
ncbi:MAG: HoxN/HupN/NixA family nickel/cobalt transporter [Gammaproteobacteria bacterium]|nr:HoxN/HupN/NixA family nickel/cobalt transporter [Gammaproteobacteria bacterium]MBU1558826.1 HoxN/HupN/NixA family nickel/cobalt transporter [Gammaproteobacteria bacterium]